LVERSPLADDTDAMGDALRPGGEVPRRRTFRSNVLLNYGTNLTVAVLALVNILIVARALGPTGRGDVAFLSAIAYITANLAALGITEANANIGASEADRRPALATNSVLFCLIFSAFSGATVLGLVAIFPAVGGDVDRTLLWVTVATVPVLILQLYLQYLIQSDYRFVVTNVAWLLSPLANVLVNGTFAALGIITVGTAVITNLCGQSLTLLVLFWYAARRLSGFGRPDLALARRSLAFGVQFHVGRIMLLGNYRLDQWLLGAISGSRQLGLYSVAVSWAEVLFFLPTALAAVQRPDLVRASRRNAAQDAASVFRKSIVLTAFLAGGLIVAAPVLCVTAFGEDFRGSILDLRVLALGAFGIVGLKQLGTALTAQRRPTLGSAAIGVGFISTLVLDVLLIPRYEGLGAALASALSYTAGGIAVVFIFSRALGASPAALLPRASDVAALARMGRDFARRLLP
jgi:O-antigen/teichoic acid export membrane protein